MTKKNTSPDRPYVQRVYSNLKSPLPGGDAWTIDIGPKTLLVGSNTSHKSAVIQSIELALSASADDIVGRSAVSDAALLLTLSPTDELGVTATLSDNDMCDFNVRSEKGKTKRPTHNGPGPECLVHRRVKEALAGSSTTARKAFLAWACDNASLEDVLAHVPSELHAKYRDISEHLGRDKNAVETLLAVVDYAGKRQRDASKEAKGAETLLSEMGEDVTKPSDEDMLRVRTAVANARETMNRAVEAATGSMSSQELDDAINEASSAKVSWEKQRDATRNAIRDIEAAQQQLSPTVEPGIQILSVAAEHGVESCPVCSSGVGASHLQQCHDYYQQQKDSWLESTTSARTKIEALQADIDSAQKNIDRWVAELTRLAEVTPRDDDTTVLPVADAQARLEAATSALASMEAHLAQWDTIAQARDRVFSMKAEAADYKLLKKASEEAVGLLLDKRVGAFTKQVNKYLPKDWDFAIELKAGGKDVFRMGLQRDGSLHCALSGAEWAAVTTAVAMVVSSRLPENRPAVLIPEDRAWDTKTLGAVMRAYSNFPGQVVMASTVKPKGRLPKNWVVIDMDEESQRWLGDEDSEVVEMPEQEPSKPVKSALETPTHGVNITTRSAIILETMGFSPEDVIKMTEDTRDVLIAENLTPSHVVIRDDGTYSMARAGTVLSMPPAPSTKPAPGTEQ
jgi:hypothetical protein